MKQVMQYTSPCLFSNVLFIIPLLRVWHDMCERIKQICYYLYSAFRDWFNTLVNERRGSLMLSALNSRSGGLHFSSVVWVIDQACSGNMGGYWPAFRSINSQKKRARPISQYPAILTEQAWSIKDLLHSFWGNFSSGTWQVVLRGQDSSILPARVANHRAEFD